MTTIMLATPTRPSIVATPSTPPKRLRRVSGDRPSPTSRKNRPQPLNLAAPRSSSAPSSSCPRIAFPTMNASRGCLHAPPSPPFTQADFAAELAHSDLVSRRRSSTSSFSSVSSEAPSLSSSCSSRSSSMSEADAHLLPALPAPSAAPSLRKCAPSHASALGDASRSMAMFTRLAFDEPAARPRSTIIPSLPSKTPNKRASGNWEGHFYQGRIEASTIFGKEQGYSSDSDSDSRSYRHSSSRPAKRRSITRASEALARIVA